MPPLTVISESVNPLGVSENVKVITAVWPMPRLLVLLVIEMVGGCALRHELSADSTGSLESP